MEQQTSSQINAAGFLRAGISPGGHSPVILIEFDHNQPANLRQLAADPTMPDVEHIHTIVRTPNGNDCGKDL